MTKLSKTGGFIFFLLLAHTHAVYAQESPTFQEKPKKIKMPKFFVAEIPKKAIPVKGITLMQAVWDSSRLGYVQKGLTNAKTEALPTKDMTAFLQEYLDKQYEDSYKKTGSQLLIMIKELRINERTFFSNEFAFTKMAADAWISTDGNMYRQVASMDTVIRYQSLADVTSVHGENIARGFYDLIMTTLDRVKAGKTGTTEMTPEQIYQKARERYQLPILTATTYKEGAYMSFREFTENNPSDASFEIKVLDEKKGKVDILDDADRIKPFVPWGICKNGEIYLYHEQELIALEKRQDGFIFSDYQEKATRRNSGIFMGGFFGGVAGAVIASSKNKMYTVTNIPYITKKQPEACAIDMQTGELTF